MSTAYIFNESLDESDRATIEAAVMTAGYEPIYSVPSLIASIDPSVDIGVVALPVATTDETAINAAMQAFAGAGIRVVCIWLHSDEGGGIGVPGGVGKYGTTVDIGSSELTEALKGETDVWEEPGGAPSPFPMTKRNKC